MNLAALLGGNPSVAPSGGNIVAGAWITFETDDPTAENLKSTSSGALISAATFGTSVTPATSTDAACTPPATINGTADTGTRGFVGTHDTQAYFSVDFNNSYPVSQSVGFCYKCTALTPDTYTTPAAWGSTSDADAIAKFRVVNTDGVLTAYLHHATGDSAPITISANTFYWITAKLVRNGTCSLAIYDTAGQQVGSTVTLLGQDNPFYGHTYGCTASTSATGDDLIDNLVVDQSSAVFPLGYS